MLIRWLILVILIVRPFSASVSEPKRLSYFQRKFPREIVLNIAEYIHEPRQLVRFSGTCRELNSLIKTHLEHRIYSIFPESVNIFEQHHRMMLSSLFYKAFTEIKAAGLSTRDLNTQDVAVLLIWHQSQRTKNYISPYFYRLITMLVEDYLNIPLNIHSQVFESDQTLQLALLRDAIQRSAAEATDFICRNGPEYLREALFQNLLTLEYPTDVLKFKQSLEYLTQFGVSEEWLSECILKRNLYLFDELIKRMPYSLNHQDFEANANLFSEFLLKICSTGFLHSSALLSRPELPSQLASSALKLCVDHHNSRMADELLKKYHPSAFLPFYAPSFIEAWKFLVLDHQSPFSVNDFHDRFGVHPELLELVDNLRYQKFFLRDRALELLKTKLYNIPPNYNRKRSDACTIS